MIEALNVRQWERVRGWVSQRTREQLKRTPALSNKLAQVATRRAYVSGRGLSPFLVREALKWAKAQGGDCGGQQSATGPDAGATRETQSDS